MNETRADLINTSILLIPVWTDLEIFLNSADPCD